VASPVYYFPLLGGVVEFDVGGAVDLKPAKLMQRHSFGPQASGCSVRCKGDDDFGLSIFHSEAFSRSSQQVSSQIHLP